MKPELRSLAFAVAGALALAVVPVTSHAQAAGQQCSDMQMLQHKCGDQKSQSKKADQGKSGEQANPYPNATRKEPKVQGVDSKEAKTLNAGLDAANSGDSATALKDLQPIADSSKSPYAKSLANLGLAQVKYKSGDIKGAIVLQKQALDAGTLPNSNYFQGLESLAQMYIQNEDYADALTTLNTWSQQSGAQSADVYALQGDAYYRLQKYPEAVAAIQKAKALSPTAQPSWDQIEMASYFAMDKYDQAAKLADAALAKDPNNSALLQNVIAIYVNSHQDQKALALLERARQWADHQPRRIHEHGEDVRQHRAQCQRSNHRRAKGGRGAAGRHAEGHRAAGVGELHLAG
ncbi:MAG TPA: tetratricopeptide repeat protein [Rhodanobacteraceae bacterium]|nr:tetratricopeptide repeat protein [Rhodanobacteraceae bacterium]